MGCDIHMRVEYQPKLDDVRFDDRWECGDLFKYTHKTREFELVPIFEDRNYGLFGALAGVRCGWFTPIREPEFPSDANEYTLKSFMAEERDSHTPSYATLSELIEYNKTQIFLTEKDIEECSREYGASTGLGKISAALAKRIEIFYWADCYKRKNPVEYYGDHIRIVFWFDN